MITVITVQLLIIKAGGVIIPINQPRDRDMFDGQLSLIQEVKIESHDGDSLSIPMFAVRVEVKRIVGLIDDLVIDNMLMSVLVDMEWENLPLRLDLLTLSIVLEVHRSWPVDNRNCIIILVI